MVRMFPDAKQTRKIKNYNDFLFLRQPIKVFEKGEYGEVFTPLKIIDEMLASLPVSVWRNPDLAWLDPACGIGNFPLKIIQGGEGYPGLLEGLSVAIPDLTKRKQHILSMLHCYDINKHNISAFRRILRDFCDCDNHVVLGDFLETRIEQRFDIVVGNPPYNSGGTKRVGEKRLHIRFTERSLSLLQKGGYLLFVCPPNYRQAGSTMNLLFLNRGIFQYIHILGPEETHKLFKVQSRVDIFLFQLGVTGGKTRILDEYGFQQDVKLDLSKHVPNFGHSIFEKMRKTPNANIRAFRSAEATTISCAGFLKRAGFPTLHLIIEEGRKVLSRRSAHSLQTVPKLIVNGLGVPYVFYDEHGSYGVTQTPLIVLEPSAELVAFTKTPLFYFLVWALRLTGNNNLPYIFDDVPADYGKGLHLTKAELALIDTFSVPTHSDVDISAICGGTKKVPKHSAA